MQGAWQSLNSKIVIWPQPTVAISNLEMVYSSQPHLKMCFKYTFQDLKYILPLLPPLNHYTVLNLILGSSGKRTLYWIETFPKFEIDYKVVLGSETQTNTQPNCHVFDLPCAEWHTMMGHAWIYCTPSISQAFTSVKTKIKTQSDSFTNAMPHTLFFAHWIPNPYCHCLTLVDCYPLLIYLENVYSIYIISIIWTA